MIVQNGHALLHNGNALAFKPYHLFWGFTQTKRDGTAAIYDLIYEHLARDFVEGESRDGGRDTGIGKDTYLHHLLIPLTSLQLPDTSENRMAVAKAIYYVCKDNPYLNCTDIIGDADGDYDDDDFTATDGYLSTVSVTCMLDIKRKTAQSHMLLTVETIKAAVYAETGKRAGDTLSVAEEKMIAKMLHDWIVNNSSYATHRSYYEQFAYVVFWNDGANHEPVCAAFAAAYTYLCQLYNINCVYIQGYSEIGWSGSGPGANHAWNMIAFGVPIGTYPTDPAAWTPVDVTFDVHLHDVGAADTDRYFGSRDIYYGRGGDTPTRWHAASFRYPVEVPTGYIEQGGGAI